MEFSFTSKGKRFAVQAKEMKGLMRGIGLVFRTRNTQNLLFKFSRPNKTAITGLFVFFPFLAIWLDKEKRVIEKKYITSFYWSATPRKNSAYLLELPINDKNLEIIEKMGFSVGKERFK